MHVQGGGTVPTEGEISLSFSSDQQSANTLLTGGGHQCCFFYLLYFSFISGFNNYSMGGEILSEYN